MAKDFKVTVRFEFNGNLKDVNIYTSEVKELMRRASYKNASRYLQNMLYFIEENDGERIYGGETFNYLDDYEYLASCVLTGTPVIQEYGWTVEDIYKVMTSKDRSLKAALKHAMTYKDMGAYDAYSVEQLIIRKQLEGKLVIE